MYEEGEEAAAREGGRHDEGYERSLMIGDGGRRNGQSSVETLTDRAIQQCYLD